jgi:tetratricopeptide (TPR) repeat protein
VKALEKDRNRRYETANAFALDVQRYLADEPVQAGPPSVGYRVRKFVRRNKGALTVGTALACALLVVVGSLGWMIRDRAVRESVIARSVRDALQGGRMAMQAKDLTLARQKLAEAQALLGKGGVALADVNQEVVDFGTELETRLGAQNRLRDFLQLIEQAHEREIPQNVALDGESIALEGRNPRAAIPLILSALKLYGVLDQDDWSSRLEHSLLEPDQVTQIRRTVYEKLLWLAGDVLFRKEGHAADGTLPGAVAARQALTYLKCAEAIPPPTRAWYWLRSRCRQPLQDSAAAKADDQRAKEAPILMAVDHWLPGLVAIGNKQEAEAVKEFESALGVDPTHYWSMLWLGWTLGDLGKGHDIGEAVRVFTGCILMRPRHAHAYVGRGHAYRKLQRYPEAIAEYSKAIALMPDHVEAWIGRGMANHKLRQYDKALADESKAIDLDPKQAIAWYNRGTTYLNAGQFAQAIADFSRAIELDPSTRSPGPIVVLHTPSWASCRRPSPTHPRPSNWTPTESSPGATGAPITWGWASWTRPSLTLPRPSKWIRSTRKSGASVALLT